MKSAASSSIYRPNYSELPTETSVTSINYSIYKLFVDVVSWFTIN